jgi:hypothetical protein
MRNAWEIFEEWGNAGTRGRDGTTKNDCTIRRAAGDESLGEDGGSVSEKAPLQDGFGEGDSAGRSGI